MKLIKGDLLSIRSREIDRIINDIIKNNVVEEFEVFLNKFGVSEKLIVVNTPMGDQVLCFKHKIPIAFLHNCSSGTASLLRLFGIKILKK